MRHRCTVCNELTHCWQKANRGEWHCYDGCVSTTGFDKRRKDLIPQSNNRYRVYRNLRTKDFSLQRFLVGRGWRLDSDHGNFKSALIYNVKPKVYEKGRQGVIENRRKNVHALLETNYFLYLAWVNDVSMFPEISYNPYESGSFFVGKNKFVGAEVVLFKSGRVYDFSKFYLDKRKFGDIVIPSRLK